METLSAAWRPDINSAGRQLAPLCRYHDRHMRDRDGMCLGTESYMRDCSMFSPDVPGFPAGHIRVVLEMPT